MIPPSQILTSKSSMNSGPDQWHALHDRRLSAMIEIADLQQRGYGLVIPQIHDKRFSVHEIR